MHACEKSSGKAEKITITNDGSRLSPEQIERMQKEAENFAEEDRLFKERTDPAVAGMGKTRVNFLGSYACVPII